jgi:hypothetical protein
MPGDPTHHQPPRLTDCTAGTSTRYGSSHSACACMKPIRCLVVFAALFSGSNSNFTHHGIEIIPPGVEAGATTSALISDVSVPRRRPWPTTSTFTPGLRHGEHPAVALPFLYRALCYVLQLIRLADRSDTTSWTTCARSPPAERERPTSEPCRVLQQLISGAGGGAQA